MLLTMRKRDTKNVTVACYFDSDLLKKWESEVLRLGDPKKVSRLGRAALRHFLFAISAEKREDLMSDEQVLSAKDLKALNERRRQAEREAQGGGKKGRVARRVKGSDLEDDEGREKQA